MSTDLHVTVTKDQEVEIDSPNTSSSGYDKGNLPGKLLEKGKLGRVKFFNASKGYGFIIPDDQDEINTNGRREVFVHYSFIQSSGCFRSLEENERVKYDLCLGPKGLQAENVTEENGSPVRSIAKPLKKVSPNDNSFIAYQMGIPTTQSYYYPMPYIIKYPAVYFYSSNDENTYNSA